MYPTRAEKPEFLVSGPEAPTQSGPWLRWRHITTWFGSMLRELMGSAFASQLPNVEANR